MGMALICTVYIPLDASPTSFPQESNIMDSTAIFDDYISENCGRCKAGFGHFIWCPLINRNTAEAWSAVSELLNASDKIRAKAFGVTFGKSCSRP